MTKTDENTATMEDLLASVQRRVTAYIISGEAEQILHKEATDEALALWAAAQIVNEFGEEAMYGEPVAALAWFAWCCYLALPEGAGESEHRLAVSLFQLVAVERIELVPETLIGTSEPDDWLDEAIRLLETCAEHDEPVMLDRAISLLRQVLLTQEGDAPTRSKVLSRLGWALRIRYTRCGNPQDLDDAVHGGIVAVETISPGPEQTAYAVDLAGHLLTRFLLNGDAADLTASINLTQSAVNGVPLLDPSLPDRLSQLGFALRVRFEHFGDPADIDAAVEVGRDAIANCPNDHPQRIGVLGNLSGSLFVRSIRRGGSADLDAAVTLANNAVDSTPPGHPDRARCQSNLADLLRLRGERYGDPADAAAALAVIESAVADIPADHPDRAVVLGNLGLCLCIQFKHGSRVADAERALRALGEGAATTTAPAVARIACAEALGEFAASLDRWPEAASGYAAAVQMLPLLVWFGLERDDVEDALQRSNGLASDAGALAAAAGDANGSVVALEQGRSVIWSQLANARTDLTRLRMTAPDLAERLEAARSALDNINRVTAKRVTAAPGSHRSPRSPVW